MFTGIVKDTAHVEKITDAGEGKRVILKGSELLGDAEKGESISVSGACLTVEEVGENSAEFFLAEETVEKTWFYSLENKDKLNIEPSLTPSDKMGGHIVQGHVETVSLVKEVEKLEEGWNISFTKPGKLSNYIVEKGFITVEGISLTVTEVEESYFAVTVIPETLDATNLSEKEEGDPVNLETDITARYIEKMVD